MAIVLTAFSIGTVIARSAGMRRFEGWAVKRSTLWVGLSSAILLSVACQPSVTVSNAAGSGGSGAQSTTTGSTKATTVSGAGGNGTGACPGGAIAGQACSKEGTQCERPYAQGCAATLTCKAGAWTDACVPCDNSSDSAIMAMVGQPCDNSASSGTSGFVCASNDGCGGCSVTCFLSTMWHPANESLCYSIPNC